MSVTAVRFWLLRGLARRVRPPGTPWPPGTPTGPRCSFGGSGSTVPLRQTLVAMGATQRQAVASLVADIAGSELHDEEALLRNVGHPIDQ